MLEGARILVVDDQELICELIGTYLVDEGCRVECAANITQMQQALQDGAFDLVILDVLLPDGSGLRLAEQARARGVPTILMSGHPALALDDAPYPLLLKPFRLSELRSAVRAVLAEPGGSPVVQQTELRNGT